MRRIHREGFFQRRILSLLGLYPWECPICRKPRLLRQRGRRARRTVPVKPA
jgi:hypothetical protein